jgi:putative ABC transport system permease protein
MMRGRWRPPVAAALSLAPLFQNRGRTVVSVLAIALGVALGYAVQLINRTAANEFAQALYTLSGEADLTVRGARAGFDEALYPVVARLPEVAVASPVIEVDARLPGRIDSLRVLGLDPFQVGRLQPALVPEGGERLDTLRSDTIFLSPAAADWLGLRRGDVLDVQVGLSQVRLQVAGLLAQGAARERLGVMDIAAAQWRLERIGTLTRIELRLRPGADIDALKAALQPRLPPGVFVERPRSTVESNLRLSRAYRVNLGVLALVALLTGGLLVFSTQALSVVRRRSELALLRVLGVTRGRMVRLLALESALIGVVGALLGLGVGHLLAAGVVQTVGADLGAGFFAGVQPQLRTDLAGLALFFCAGVLAALAGGMLPALEAARAQPAQALKAGDAQSAYGALRSPWPGVVFTLAGAALTRLPPVEGLPLFGYCAIALLLIGAITLMPWVAARLFAVLPLPRAAWAALAVAQMRGAAAQAGVSLASIVAAVGLLVSMSIMVASFRISLDQWLHRMLPADVYLRAGSAGDTGFLDEAVQKAIARMPGVQRVEFLRAQQVLLDPTRPRLTLLARDLPPARAATVLPLVMPALEPLPSDPPPIWITEPVADLFALRPGSRIEVPLAGRKVSFTVAGVWRDYARQNGALLIDRALYVKLTGDRLATDAGLWLLPDASPAQFEHAMRVAIPESRQIELSDPGEIRRLSLSIFDRTFAVTYALEICALVIGLFGLSSSIAAQVLARRREFGMLRHIGMTRRRIAAMLATEGVLAGTLGLAIGLALGWLISLILVHVVNRQSFHWSMSLHVPWGALALFAAVMLLLASATAVLSGRHAMGGDVVRAVKEDW